MNFNDGMIQYRTSPLHIERLIEGALHGNVADHDELLLLSPMAIGPHLFNIDRLALVSDNLELLPLSEYMYSAIRLGSIDLMSRITEEGGYDDWGINTHIIPSLNIAEHLALNLNIIDGVTFAEVVGRYATVDQYRQYYDTTVVPAVFSSALRYGNYELANELYSDDLLTIEEIPLLRNPDIIARYLSRVVDVSALLRNAIISNDDATIDEVLQLTNATVTLYPDEISATVAAWVPRNRVRMQSLAPNNIELNRVILNRDLILVPRFTEATSLKVIRDAIETSPHNRRSILRLILLRPEFYLQDRETVAQL